MNTYRAIEMQVIEWATARRIIPNSHPLAQARKTAEEATELVEAATKLRVLQELGNLIPELKSTDAYVEYHAKAVNEFKDAVGDVMVTLTNACALADVDAMDCFAGSYDVIKDRKGTLMPNGVFVKES